MRWHKEKRVDDNVIRHPADREAWKKFDQTFLEFTANPQNVRLRLALTGSICLGSKPTPQHLADFHISI